MDEMTPRQCAAARAYLGLSRERVGKESGVGRNTVARFEAGARLNESTFNAILLYFNRLGVSFPNARTIAFPEIDSNLARKENKTNEQA